MLTKWQKLAFKAHFVDYDERDDWTVTDTSFLIMMILIDLLMLSALVPFAYFLYDLARTVLY